jgi:hypothetical protein
MGEQHGSESAVPVQRGEQDLQAEQKGDLRDQQRHEQRFQRPPRPAAPGTRLVLQRAQRER